MASFLTQMIPNIEMYKDILAFIRSTFQSEADFIPLHEPRFIGNERNYVVDAIDSTFVSSVGAYVNRFEEMMAEYTGAQFAIATVNGTAALHISLLLAGVQPGDLILTQAVSFIATCNCISYAGAEPVFIDVDFWKANSCMCTYAHVWSSRKDRYYIDLMSGILCATY
jgi:dTDP-4-amino-4,6-dideoxygalactose transaminase